MKNLFITLLLFFLSNGQIINISASQIQAVTPDNGFTRVYVSETKYYSVVDDFKTVYISWLNSICE